MKWSELYIDYAGDLCCTEIDGIWLIEGMACYHKSQSIKHVCILARFIPD